MGINTIYAEELHDNLGYLATWLPTANVQVGDIGVISDGVFEKKGTLKDLGIAFSSEVNPQTGEMEYASKDAVSIEVKGGGHAPVPAGAAGAVDAEASVVVSFNRADAVLFQAAGCKTTTLSNLMQVSNTILDLYDAGDWPKDRVVVTDVVVSDSATVLISSGSDAHIELSASGAVGAGKASLANASLKFGGGRSSSIGTTIVGAKGTTALFKASGIKKKLFRRPVVTTRDAADGSQLGPLDLKDLVGPPGDLGG
jgi:hypothetical protein